MYHLNVLFYKLKKDPINTDLVNSCKLILLVALAYRQGNKLFIQDLFDGNLAQKGAQFFSRVLKNLFSFLVVGIRCELVCQSFEILR